MVGRLLVALVFVALTLTAAPAQAVQLGAADDLRLYSVGGDAARGTLASMKAHHVRYVRIVLYQGYDNTKAWESIRTARAMRLRVQVVLTQPFFAPVAGDFPPWAADQARQLGALKVRRISILNEPDHFLPGSMEDRAQTAVSVWRQTIPLIRRAVRHVRILVGETSSLLGVRDFIARVQQLGYPHADGWAHHPYPHTDLGIENIEQLKVREPVYWTEFGTAVRTMPGAESLDAARQRWQLALEKARRLHVREIVAYGWFATGTDWDTAAEGVLF